MTRHALRDGRTVTLRPARADDRERQARFLASLSPEARHNRFQLVPDEEVDAMAGSFARIDPARQSAFVCTVGEGDDERIVGDARYYVNPDGRSCEFGIVLADDWHRTGVARLLMDALIRDAGERGLRSIDSLVLASNRAMLGLAAAYGFEAEALPVEPARVRISRPL